MMYLCFSSGGLPPPRNISPPAAPFPKCHPFSSRSPAGLSISSGPRAPLWNSLPVPLFIFHHFRLPAARSRFGADFHRFLAKKKRILKKEKSDFHPSPSIRNPPSAYNGRVEWEQFTCTSLITENRSPGSHFNSFYSIFLPSFYRKKVVQYSA